MRFAASFSLVVLLVGCAPAPSDLCAHLAVACAGDNADNWRTWCLSDCVPEQARTQPCSLNDRCILCDGSSGDARVTLFAFPSDDLEYLWTQTVGPGEAIYPSEQDAPTGSAFVDDASDWPSRWRAFDPFPDLTLESADGFCEPGPNHFVTSNVLPTADGLMLQAHRLAEDASLDALFCPNAMCGDRPYIECGAPPTGCQYGDAPDTQGLGDASQLDRVESDAIATYGYGHYRAIMSAAGPTTEAQPGFVYAFYVQGSEPCEDGQTNFETNTSEIDVELTSGTGQVEGEPFCRPGQMCLQLTTWASSTQGIARGAGVLRHEVSGFRFRDAATAGSLHTFGFDWHESDVRFTYDREPHDCDESAGACDAHLSSLAMCQHVRYVPRRPSPLHLQLWSAWWAGDAARGAEAQMSVERVWHGPD